MKTLLLAVLLSLPAHAAPTEHLAGISQRNEACASGYQIYRAGESYNDRIVHCLIWSNRVPAAVRRAVESEQSSYLFFGERVKDGFVVASVRPLGSM